MKEKWKKCRKQVLLKNVTSSKMQTNFYSRHCSSLLNSFDIPLPQSLHSPKLPVAPGEWAPARSPWTRSGSLQCGDCYIAFLFGTVAKLFEAFAFCREPGVGAFNPLRRASAPAVAMVPVPGPTLPGLSAGTVVGSTAVGTPKGRLKPGLVRKVNMEKYHDIPTCLYMSHVNSSMSSMI